MRWTPNPLPLKRPRSPISRRRFLEEGFVIATFKIIDYVWDKIEPYVAGAAALLGAAISLLAGIPPWISLGIALVIFLLLAWLMHHVTSRQRLHEAHTMGDQIGEYLRPGMEATIPRSFAEMEQRLGGKLGKQIDERINERLILKTEELVEGVAVHFFELIEKRQDEEKK